MMGQRMLLGFVALISLFAAGVQADDVGPGDVLSNGGFEEWGVYVPAKGFKVNPTVPNSSAPPNWSPTADAYERATDATFPVQVTIARDQTVKHTGASSVRITNGRGSDMGMVYSRQYEVLPNQAYRFRVWYKGEKIEPGTDRGVGAYFSISQGPESFWSDQTTQGVTPKIKDGTFDWRLIEVSFKTKPTTRKVMLSLQLRSAKGTVWYDDAQLVPVMAPSTVSVFSARREEDRPAAAPIFQADFNGDGRGTGGATNLVSIGGGGTLVNTPRVTTSIVGARPLGPGGGNYVNIVTASDMKWSTAIQMSPTSSASVASLYSVVEGHGVLNGGFDVFVRLNAIPKEGNAEWLWPMTTTNADAKHLLHVMLSGLASGTIRLQVDSYGDALSDFRKIAGTDGTGGVSDFTAAQNKVMIQSRSFKVTTTGSTYHLAGTFDTDAAGVITMKLFGVEGTGPIDSSRPLVAGTFKIDAQVLGDNPFGTHAWMVGVQASGKPLDVDYDCMRVYSRDPGVFPGLSAADAASTRP